MIKEEWMNVALALAKSTIGQTSPNPSVGAIVVKNGKVVGIGSHLEAGKEHAEVYALKQAAEQAEDADIYVTLEPCAHVGKTPPCTDLIIQHKIKNVYIACLDPNPVVAGKGVRKLRQAGIHVEIGIREAEVQKIYRKFFHFIKTKRPYVTLKAAMTLDGKIATSSGDSRWITSKEARLDVHKERDKHDAILIGVNTVMNDNPQLTTRLPQGGKSPIRVILDTQLKMTGNANVLNNDAPTWIFCGAQANREAFIANHPHIRVYQLPTNSVELEGVLAILGEKGIQALYVEGGGTIHKSFIDTKMFDECHWYIAPTLLGGSDAYSVVGGKSPQYMKEAESLQFISIQQIGPDIKIIAHPKREEG